MKRLAVLTFLLTLLAACSGGGEPTSTAEPSARVEVLPGSVARSVLLRDDVADGWTAEENASPSTIQVGGKVGPANVKDAEQEATTAFRQNGGSGYVTNSIFLVESADVARAVIAAHRQATVESWTQERKDGGGAAFRRTGEVSGLPALGDEMFSASINTTIRTGGQGEGPEVKRKIQYVVYRLDRLLAFVISQDTGVNTYARRQEKKVARLVS
jgi:hypothetical protein